MRADGPDSVGAHVQVTLGEASFTVEIDDREPHLLSLPVAVCDSAMTLLRATLASLSTTKAEPVLPTPMDTDTQWRTGWQFTAWQPVAERIRDLVLAADPTPRNLFPERLVDTQLDFFRPVVPQRAADATLDVTLTLGKET